MGHWDRGRGLWCRRGGFGGGGLGWSCCVVFVAAAGGGTGAGAGVGGVVGGECMVSTDAAGVAG